MDDPHNALLAHAVEAGIVGLAALLAWVGAFYAKMLRAGPDGGADAAWAAGIVGAVRPPDPGPAQSRRARDEGALRVPARRWPGTSGSGAPRMTVVDAFALVVLCIPPGLAFLWLLDDDDRRAVPRDEAAFLAVAVSVAASAWVGLVLAEAGLFSLVRGAIAVFALSAAVVMVGRGRRRGPFRATDPRSAAPAMLVLGMALALQARPSEHVIGGRDPGVYVSTMALVSRTGALAPVDTAVSSIPPDARPLFFEDASARPFSWERFGGIYLEHPASARVFPQFFHLFPVFGAYLFEAAGMAGALATPALFGVLGTLAVFFALRRVLGPAPALLAALLLGLNVLQVWFARYPVSETLVQLLVFLGILAASHWEDRGSAAFGALAGCCFGLALLARIDAILLVLALVLWLLARRAGGLSRTPWPLLVPFGLLALHAGLHGWRFAGKYVHDILAMGYGKAALLWSFPAAAALALAWAAAGRARDRVQRHAGAVRWAAAAAVCGLFLYAYLLRPELSAWAGGDGNDPARAVAGGGWLAALGYGRLAAHDAQSLVRLGWFVTPPGLVLAVLGFLLLIRDFRARHALAVAIVFTFAAFYLYKTRISSDYFFALRRFLPVVLPGLLGFAALALTTLAERGRAWRGAAVLAGAGLATAYGLETSRIAEHVDWREAAGFVSQVADLFGPQDIVLAEQESSVEMVAVPLWAVHGVKVLVLGQRQPDPARVALLVNDRRANEAPSSCSARTGRTSVRSSPSASGRST